MGIRKQLHSFLGKAFNATKFRSNINLAVARLSVLKNQHRARFSIARSDVVELLKLGNHDSALLRVEQVIKEQNMLDVFSVIEGYCHLLIERANLIAQEKGCPDELKEAASSLIYAATRVGELPELQKMRAIFRAQFGKEFEASAIELRNGCTVNLKIIQKLSTRIPCLENKLKVLEEIGLEYNIDLQIEKNASVFAVENLEHGKENQQNSYTEITSGVSKPEESRTMKHVDMERVENFHNFMKMRRTYTDVADAAQEAFESASYAAAAARAAVELSRSDSTNSYSPRSPRKKEQYNIRTEISANDGFKETKKSYGEEDPPKREIVSNESDDEAAHRSVTPRSETYFLNDSVKDDTSKEGSRKPYSSSQKPFPLRSQTGLIMKYGPENSQKSFAEEIGKQGDVHLDVKKRPMSVRTRRTYGR